MDKLKLCPFTRKEKLAVNNLKIDNGNGAYITKRDADVLLHYIEFLQSEVEKLNAAPENNPLTLEQLRQMDGEPVWVETMQEWRMVCVDRENGLVRLYTVFNTISAEHVLDNDGRIYAHKPESEENHAEY